MNAHACVVHMYKIMWIFFKVTSCGCWASTNGSELYYTSIYNYHTLMEITFLKSLKATNVNLSRYK